MTDKNKEILGRVIFGIIIGFLLFLILDPDDEHGSPKPEKETITTVGLLIVIPLYLLHE